MTHLKSERCPRVADDWQWEVANGTCCTMDLTAIVEILRGFGELDLVKRIHSQLSAEECVTLGEELEIRGEKIMNGGCDEPGRGKERLFLANCDEIMSAGSWYQKLGADGFGVLPVLT